MLNSLSTTVQTPRKWPGRLAIRQEHRQVGARLDAHQPQLRRGFQEHRPRRLQAVLRSEDLQFGKATHLVDLVEANFEVEAAPLQVGNAASLPHDGDGAV